MVRGCCSPVCGPERRLKDVLSYVAKIVGGIGVSGVDSKDDAQIAQAGDAALLLFTLPTT